MKKRDVRSQSGVITLILIILLVLVAMVILWNVVNYTIKKSSNEVSINQFAFKGDLVYALGSSNTTMNVSVHRGSGGGNITGFKLIFDFSDGTSKLYENRTIYPNELETKIYLISNNTLNVVNFSKLTKISLYYTFNENNKEKFSILLDTADGPSSGSSGGSDSTSSCSYSNWANQRCGMSVGSTICSINQMYQNRSIVSGSGTGCTDISQCVSNDTCTLISSAVSYWTMDNINGNIVVDSLGRNNGTLGNATSGTRPTWNSSGKYGGAYKFDGVNDYINLGDIDQFENNNKITVSAWVNINPAHAAWERVVDNGWNKGFAMATNGFDNSFGLWIGNTSTTGNVITTRNISSSTWHQIVGIANGTSLLIYVDGVLNNTAVQTSAVGLNNYNVTIGADMSTSPNEEWFNGTIDELIIFNRSLSQAEITKLYNYDY